MKIFVEVHVHGDDGRPPWVDEIVCLLKKLVSASDDRAAMVDLRKDAVAQTEALGAAIPDVGTTP